MEDTVSTLTLIIDLDMLTDDREGTEEAIDSMLSTALHIRGKAVNGITAVIGPEAMAKANAEIEGALAEGDSYPLPRTIRSILRRWQEFAPEEQEMHAGLYERLTAIDGVKVYPPQRGQRAYLRISRFGETVGYMNSKNFLFMGPAAEIAQDYLNQHSDDEAYPIYQSGGRLRASYRNALDLITSIIKQSNSNSGA